jgi:hypothetical protein
MRFSFWFRTINGLALAGLLTWACGSDDEKPSSTGGDAGHPATNGGAAGQASQGDGGSEPDPCIAEPDSDACKEVPWCGPFSLQEVCGPTPFPLCPTSFADWRERTPCDSVTKLEAYDTTCGGRALVRYYEGKTESWEFDADDKLVSVLVEGDSLHECAEGGRSKNWLFGVEQCKSEPGTTVDPCVSEGGAGAGGSGSDPTPLGGSAAGGVGGAP